MELRCIPPDGNPVAELSWTKNGVTVDPKQDPNYIISNEGNLLIVAAKLSDMANYSCVAENVANRRVSPPARLTVYGTWCSGCRQATHERARGGRASGEVRCQLGQSDLQNADVSMLDAWVSVPVWAQNVR